MRGVLRYGWRQTRRTPWLIVYFALASHATLALARMAGYDGKHRLAAELLVDAILPVVIGVYRAVTELRAERRERP